ncbi:MAG: phytoene/squalene synthase family protein [Candidatus Limnocylindrales bacterium]
MIAHGRWLSRTAPRTAGLDPEVDARARAVMRDAARSFDLAARFLPADLRRDVRRLYLVLRTLDDLVDHAVPGADGRLAMVEAWAVGGAPRGPEAPILEALVAAHPDFPRDAVADLCLGMRTDLAGPRHATGADLDRYCYQVAGTVGRMMAAILGVAPGREAEADLAARALGAAMQRTNILRDLREDAGRGRTYLPADCLLASGLDPDPASAGGGALDGWAPTACAAVLREQIARADHDYETGLAGIRHLRRGRWAVAAAALLYREILREIERGGLPPGPRRAVVSRRRKLALLLTLPRALP